MNGFNLWFILILLLPLLAFDLMFDDKQELFMQGDHGIIMATIMVSLFWATGMYILNQRYSICKREVSRND